MAKTLQFVNGNTQQVVRELPFDQAPDSIRYVFLMGGIRVRTREESDQQIEIARVVLFTFDADGNLTDDRPYNGFLKKMDAAGNQVEESIVSFEGGGPLKIPAEYGGNWMR